MILYFAKIWTITNCRSHSPKIDFSFHKWWHIHPWEAKVIFLGFSMLRKSIVPFATEAAGSLFVITQSDSNATFQRLGGGEVICLLATESDLGEPPCGGGGGGSSICRVDTCCHLKGRGNMLIAPVFKHGVTEASFFSPPRYPKPMEANERIPFRKLQAWYL